MNHDWFKNLKNKPEVEAAIQDSILTRLTQFQGKSKLRKAAMQLLVKQMQQCVFTELKTVFDEMDTDKSGTLEKHELQRAFTQKESSLGHLSKAQINVILKELDMNQDNRVTYTEFIAAAIDPKLINDETMLKGLFDQFDTDMSGEIDPEELHKSFSKFGQNISCDEIKAVMKAHDKGKDGKMQFDDFKCMILDEFQLCDHEDE